MRVLVDMDGVLADFDGEFLKRWRERYPEKFFVPLEKRRGFYVRDQYPDELKPLVTEIIEEAGFFRHMLLVSGAKDGLLEMAALGIELFICTSPLPVYKNCVLEKFEWVERELGLEWTERIILTMDKTLVKADYLIDDKPVIAGVEHAPSWEQVIYDHPYNRDINKRRLTWKNWKTVLNLDG